MTAAKSPELVRADALVDQLLDLLNQEANASVGIFALAIAAARRLFADAGDEGQYHANFGLFVSCVSRVAAELVDEQAADDAAEEE